MSVIRIMTNFNIELEFPAVPFHRRLFAWLIDLVILFIYIRIVIWFMNSVSSSANEEMMGAVGLLLLIPLLTYHLLSEIMMNGQSFGKKLMGIRVVNENGGQPGMGQFIIRWLIRTSDWIPFILLLLATAGSQNAYFIGTIVWEYLIAISLLITDLILVNASKKNQRLGDMLAHTLLIRSSQKHSIRDTVFLNIENSYKPSFPQVMQLSDRDMNSLKGILDTAKKRDDYNLAEMAAEKIKSHLKIDTNLSPFDFLEVLLKDYNYLSAN